ncbi:deazaflavin-dependent oxidoreductase (nitroreductase family) [Microbacteriaceae bacterium SG_E_30_P1]|uniref:Deazaflavin-dependent oxidoreductase (Nitroreductase family) n=1 Tax=Antiquaquibacter oligotrophicus TaxID=2880260 RepID=A0ABT6KR04_9MICO|nr:nitroreductase family deazaflavin-dependent oxidoreductase [Antiquaquibacter oligotrophicus]MDH6182246.1 deazaflavin-dependent oxidoreductase (nitroreductase family) [Antiquaquibacter oligotrophicus]UDF12095.1 nitroreductase family deazaflavin-dependent oxidoreductase [Antiquaquibacter oligotrophicus]
MTDFNSAIIADFRANGGYVGAPFHSDKLVLLHHVGAKSGVERVSPLMSFPGDDNWIVVASKGGAPENPGWYYNLLAHPDTVIEYGNETVPVHATVVEGAERDDLWRYITSVNAGFASYEKKTSRTIPLVRLTRR